MIEGTNEHGEEDTNVDVSADGMGLERDTKRKVYLITYSKADTGAFDKQCLADPAISAFNSEMKSEINHVYCCFERHKDGVPHYHIAIFLDKEQGGAGFKSTCKASMA